MSEDGRLTGITWNHTRGYLPLVATAHRFSEQHPGVEIEWQRRSLQDFADYPVEVLAERFDLLIIDHPFVGSAAALEIFLPLDDLLPREFLADQAEQSVGASHASYAYDGHQWALAIDAAAPVSSHRVDLLARQGLEAPRTWEELIKLARRGLVAVPAIPVDTLCNFYMMCLAFGEEPLAAPDRIASPEIGGAALDSLRELVGLCDPACLRRNPIATYEAMVTPDGPAYCPFAFGYANYARAEYAGHPLRFGGLVTFGGRRLRSTLGGTGLAISRGCLNRQLAAQYAQFVASPYCQRGLYFVSGGQPGHRSAWLDPEVNRRSNNYFADTLQTLDEAWLRPRQRGYIAFQEAASLAVFRYVAEGGDASATIAELDRLYRQYRGAATDGTSPA